MKNITKSIISSKKNKKIKVKDIDFTLLPFTYAVFKRLSKKSQWYWLSYLKKKPKNTFKKFKIDKRRKYWMKFRYEMIIKRKNHLNNSRLFKRLMSLRLKDRFKLKMIFRKFMNERFLNLKYNKFKLELKRFKIKKSVNSFFCYIELRVDRSLIRAHFAWNIKKAQESIKKKKIYLNDILVVNNKKHLKLNDKLHIDKNYWKKNVKFRAIYKSHMKFYTVSYNHIVTDYKIGTLILINIPYPSEIINFNKNEVWIKSKSIRLLINSFF